MSNARMSYNILYKIIIIFVFHYEIQLIGGRPIPMISYNDLETNTLMQDMVENTANVMKRNSLHQKIKDNIKSSLAKNTEGPTTPVSEKPLFIEEKLKLYPFKKSGVVTEKTLKNYSATRRLKLTTCFSAVDNVNSDCNDNTMSYSTTNELVQDESINLAVSSTSSDAVYNNRPSTAISEIAKSTDVTTGMDGVISQETAAQRRSRRPMEDLTKQLNRLVVELLMSTTAVTTDTAVPTVLKVSTNKRKSVTAKKVVSSSSQSNTLLQHSMPRHKISTRYFQTMRNRQNTSIPRVSIRNRKRKGDDSKCSRGKSNAVPSIQVAIPKSINDVYKRRKVRGSRDWESFVPIPYCGGFIGTSLSH